MEGLLFLFGLFLALGLFFLTASVLKLPTLSDRNGRTVVFSVIAALVTPVILIATMIMCTLSGTVDHNISAVQLSFHGGYLSSKVPAEYRMYIENMQDSFEKLDGVLNEINGMAEAEEVDPYQVKAIFYALFFGKEHPRMLLLASSDAEKWTIHTSEVNVDTLLISLYEAYEPRCMKKKIKLTLDLGEELFPVIMTDKERLFQLLSIYLDNALHYSPEGKEIQIRVDMSSKELTFWIADHGIGVEEKDKPFIFDRFYCADQSHTDKSHFGLGLSIAKELARMLQGKIGMEDTPGGGASFFFTLALK